MVVRRLIDSTSNIRSASNQAAISMLEHLEGRVLCSTTITAVDVGTVLATAGQAVTVSIAATSPHGVRAATIFRDINENNRFDAGVDQPLGDIFTPNAQGRFVRAITPGADWGRSVRLGVNAVDNANHWSAIGARRVDLNVNQRPAFTSADISTATINEGGMLSITVRAADDTGIRAVTAYVDRNGDGRWTGGTDISLGTDFTAGPAGNFVITAAANPAWHNSGMSANIRVDAVDVDNAWATLPRLAGAVTVNRAPAISAFSVRWDSVQPGSHVNPLKLSITAPAAAAATFWLDLDDNNRWTPGVDFSLGDVRESVAGVFTMYVPSDLAGRGAVNVSGSAVTAAGAWALTPVAAQVANLRIPALHNFIVDADSSSILLGAEASYPGTPSAASERVPLVDFFADVNFNGVYEEGVDSMVASVAPGTALSNGAWRHRVSLSPAQIAALPSVDFRWTAAPRIVFPGGVAISGAGRTAEPRDFVVGEPVLTRISALISGLEYVSDAAAGQDFSVEVSAFVASGVAALTLFWDSNLNNRWDAGVDIHLGDYVPSSQVTSLTHSFSGVLPDRAGPGAFAATVQAQNNNAWSSIRTTAPVNIRHVAAPEMVSAVSGSGSVSITLAAASFAGVSSFAAFIDLNDDGVQDEGEAITFGLVRTGGTARNGVWVLTANTPTLTAGQAYTIKVQSRDAAGTVSALTSVGFTAG